ncbi:MAG: energy transducer TonB [Terracidiphilus sp.]|jgi:TonB family protein
MRRELTVAFLLLLPTPFAAIQQANPPTPPQPPSASLAQSKPADPPAAASSAPAAPSAEHIAPPVAITQINPEYSLEARKNKISGICLVAFTVGADGIPRDVHVVKSLDPTLDANTVQAIETWKFQPAIKNGNEPVPFDLTVESAFHLFETGKAGAVVAIPERPGAPGTLLTSDEINATPAVPIRQVPPKYPFMERARRKSGDCTLKMTIDSEGVPRNVRVVESLDPSFDASAIKAVEQWRYEPATVNGAPYPEESTVIVKFQLAR